MLRNHKPKPMEPWNMQRIWTLWHELVENMWTHEHASLTILSLLGGKPCNRGEQPQTMLTICHISGHMHTDAWIVIWHHTMILWSIVVLVNHLTLYIVNWSPLIVKSSNRMGVNIIGDKYNHKHYTLYKDKGHSPLHQVKRHKNIME